MLQKLVLSALVAFLSLTSELAAEEKTYPYPIGSKDWVWSYQCPRQPCAANIAGVPVPARTDEFTVVLTELTVGGQKVPAYFWWVTKPLDTNASGSSVVSSQASNSTVIAIQGFTLKSVIQPH
jgi:hypothetical protein